MNSLSLRMVIYLVCGVVAGMLGPVSFDQAAGTLTIDVNALTGLAGGGGVAGFLATFAASRKAKRRGGNT